MSDPITRLNAALEGRYTPKLQSYLSWVKAETGRDVFVEGMPIADLAGIEFGFRDHPTKINVLVGDPPACSEVDFERGMAHEATHGLLLYGRGYARVREIGNPPAAVVHSMGILQSMIDDVVGDKIVQDHGFAPYAEKYPRTVITETKAARKAQVDIYASVSEDAEVCRRFRLYRCVTALAFLAFYELPGEMRKKLKKFTKAFASGYPKDMEECKWIAGLLQENDVFTAPGQRSILESVIERWGLGTHGEVV